MRYPIFSGYETEESYDFLQFTGSVVHALRSRRRHIICFTKR
ncbi:hypothetical protein DsansV1_C09g0090371 [Dioscorea sansibarensis]